MPICEIDNVRPIGVTSIGLTYLLMKTNTDKENMLDHNYLLSILEYNKSTGEFINKVTRTRSKIGSRAGTISKKYRAICINSILYLEHRLVWFYVYKRWPTNMIDHINGIKTDNRLENLREADNSTNNFNRDKPSTNTSGFKGVNKHGNRYQAAITFNKERIYIGSYLTAEEASIAYNNKAAELHKEFYYEAKKVGIL